MKTTETLGCQSYLLHYILTKQTIFDPEEIKSAIHNFNLQGTSIISIEDREWLQRNFAEEDVWDNIKSCATDKAPRPDGFNMNFF